MRSILTMTAAALSLASPVAAQPHPGDIVALQERYRACLTDKTLELGRGNTESADTVLRAAHAACLSVENQLRNSYDPIIGFGFTARKVDELMTRDRQQGENAGILALLEARAAGHK